MRNKIIVTGGAGFIGSNFVRVALKENVDQVMIIDKLTYAGHPLTFEDVRRDKRVQFVPMDIANQSEILSILRKTHASALLNFAAETHVDRSIDGPRAFIETNIVGTFELLEASRKYFGELNDQEKSEFRFLHVSTDEVYGALGPTGLFLENTPYAPNSPYAASKAAADHLVNAYHVTYNLPTLITNCSNNYGPFQFPEKLIPLMILNALEGRPLPLYGDGGQVRDWIFVEDHCEGIWRVLQKGPAGEKYNIGASEERTNLDVVKTICSVLEEFSPAAQNVKLRDRKISSYTQLQQFVTDRPGHDRRYAINAQKIKKDLGWTPQHSFEEGIKKTIRWYLDNRRWCDEVQSGRTTRERLGLAPAK